MVFLRALLSGVDPQNILFIWGYTVYYVIIQSVILIFNTLTLIRPGFFDNLKSGGGGGGNPPPPPQISAAERRKIMKFGTCVECVDTNKLAKFFY